jgi:uncharacterized coiled-coil protein SlyX
MAAQEERLAVLERTVNEHSVNVGGLRESVDRLDQGMLLLDQRMDSLEHRMDGLEHRMDLLGLRMDHLDQRMGRLESSMARVEQRLDRLPEWMTAGFQGLDKKMSQQFAWILGVQVTVLLAFVGSVVSIIVLLAPQ